MLKKPQNVYLPIDKFQAKVFKNGEDKRGEWVSNFALALAEEAEDPFAKELLKKAQADLYKDILRGWRFNARRALEAAGCQNPTDFQVHEKCIEDFGDEYLEAIELLASTSKRIRNSLEKKFNRDFMAGAPTREDGEFKSDSGDAVNLESATSANNSEARESRRTEGHSMSKGVNGPSVRNLGRQARRPRDREEFHAFVADNNLHEGLAEEWYAIHEAREWVDEDGNPIRNWKGALNNYCTKTESKRRTA